jgi:hypothetical protein
LRVCGPSGWLVLVGLVPGEVGYSWRGATCSELLSTFPAFQCLHKCCKGYFAALPSLFLLSGPGGQAREDGKFVFLRVPLTSFSVSVTPRRVSRRLSRLHVSARVPVSLPTVWWFWPRCSACLARVCCAVVSLWMSGRPSHLVYLALGTGLDTSSHAACLKDFCKVFPDIRCPRDCKVTFDSGGMHIYNCLMAAHGESNVAIPPSSSFRDKGASC